MFAARKFLAARAFPRLAAASFLLSLLFLLELAKSAEPRIDFILKTNVNKVDIHFGAEANRKYVLQGINFFPCTNCPGGIVSTNWTNLLTVLAAPFPPSNHFIFRDNTTNRFRYYRLVSP